MANKAALVSQHRVKENTAIYKDLIIVISIVLLF